MLPCSSCVLGDQREMLPKFRQVQTLRFKEQALTKYSKSFFLNGIGPYLIKREMKVSNLETNVILICVVACYVFTRSVLVVLIFLYIFVCLNV